MKRGFLVATIGMFLCVSPDAQSQVVISEIMYHPVEEAAFNADGTPVLDLYEDVHEFVELHNPTSGTISLSEWKITGGINFTFPAGSQIGAGEFVVIAKDKARLAAVNAYHLSEAALFGPYAGYLSNDRETIRLRDARSNVVDSVSYSASFPWPIGADGLGADEEWTGSRPMSFQYRGRSLERVSLVHSGNDPANWVASPLPGEPSPGKPNSTNRPQPKPALINLRLAQARDGRRLIRTGESARLDCLFSATNYLSRVNVEFFLDNIEVTNEVPVRAEMFPVTQPADGRYAATLPGFPQRSIVRYRIRADRGEGDEVISPRVDDPFAWHAYFVTPERASTNRIYEVFISSKSLRTLQTNITQNPRRVTSPDPPGYPRKSWNATEPAFFVYDGVVRDVRMRHHGSRYRRDVNRRSYKFQFPRFNRFDGYESVFVTDKDYQTQAGHALFREAELPTSLTRWVDLYLNNNTRLVRLEQEEYDGHLLERYHGEQAGLHPERPWPEVGEIFKCVGFDGTSEGPYGNGNGKQLPARLPYWTVLQRYEWTFALQDHGWRGHTQFKEMIDQMWLARGTATVNTNALRAYFQKYWDVDRELTYLSVINWMVPWDDTFHNYFVWQKRDGRWCQLPWDFDSVMNGQSSNASIFTGAPFAGANYFKDSFIKAFRDEFRERAWTLNNTILHPDHLTALGVSPNIRTWANSRLKSVNTQTGLGTFERPIKPVNVSPAPGQSLGPFVVLQASEYSYSTNPAPRHASTTWMVRSRAGSYYAPVFKITSTNELTRVPAPFDRLKLGETYFWKCVYTDAVGHPSLASTETAFTVGPTAHEFGVIRLNEIMASNRATLQNGGRFPDWIELYNPSDLTQSLKGLTLTDDLQTPSKFQFPDNSVLPPRGFLIIWCDAANTDPGLHTGFALDANGQTIGLFAASTNGPVLQDVVTFGLQLPDLSIGRANAASEEWTLNAPTPNAGNQAMALASSARLRINEWLANSISDDDWFELFNSEARPVALAGFYFTDDLDRFNTSRVTGLSFIGANSFVKFVADAKPQKGSQHVSFKLNSAGGSIGFYAADGSLVDSVMYPAQAAESSQGRVPDGAAEVFTFTQPTPAASNSVDSDLDGLPDIWELAFGLDANFAADAQRDDDGDGLTNLQEHLLGTDPWNPGSKLQIEVAIASEASTAPVLSFRAAAGRSYAIEYRDALMEGAWRKLFDIPTQPISRRIELTDPTLMQSSSRYYRVTFP